MKICCLPNSYGEISITLRSETEAEEYQLKGVIRTLKSFRAKFDWNDISLTIKIQGKD
jgi:hypothetical protein